jgi:hypothetical protein
MAGGEGKGAMGGNTVLRERRPVDRERAVEENVEAGKIKEAGDEV